MSSYTASDTPLCPWTPRAKRKPRAALRTIVTDRGEAYRRILDFFTSHPGYARLSAYFAKHTERAAQGGALNEGMRIGRQRDMACEPNRDLLTEAERAEYRRFDHMNNLTFREQFRAHVLTWVALFAWAALMIVLCMVVTSTDTTEPAGTRARGEEITSMVVFLIVLLGGGAGVFVIAKHVGTRALRHGREALLDRIGYADRVKTVSEDDYYSPTVRQTQHAWYQGHSELNWQDRVRAESYGMDVDSYINNVAEHDKD